MEWCSRSSGTVLLCCILYLPYKRAMPLTLGRCFTYRVPSPPRKGPVHQTSLPACPWPQHSSNQEPGGIGWVQIPGGQARAGMWTQIDPIRAPEIPREGMWRRGRVDDWEGGGGHINAISVQSMCDVSVSDSRPFTIFIYIYFFKQIKNMMTLHEHIKCVGESSLVCSHTVSLSLSLSHTHTHTHFQTYKHTITIVCPSHFIIHIHTCTHIHTEN